MKKPILGAAAAAIAIALCIAAASAFAKAENVNPQNEAQITALQRTLMAGISSHDIDKMMSVYWPSEHLFVFDVIPPRQYVGIDAYRKDWQGVINGFKGPIKATAAQLAVTNDDKLGFSHCVWELSGTATDGKPFAANFRVTDGYRKIHGKWMIVEEHISVPVNLDTGKADILSKP